jgi:hypothetical protein
MNPFRNVYLQELTAKQKEIDKNKNNKIDGEDLAHLRKKEEMKEGAVPAHMQGKQKPYVSSDGKGNYEVLGNKGQTKAEFSRKEHGKDAQSKAQAHLKSKYNEYMKEETVEEASLKDACWTGYTAIGMKMKNGKKVPNCVPVKEEELTELSKSTLDSYREKAFHDQPSSREDNPAKYDKRKKGRSTAFDKVLGRKPAKEYKEEVEIDEKLTVGGGVPVKGPNGVVSNTPAKKPVTSSAPTKPATPTKPQSSLDKIRARLDSARKSVKEASMTTAERDAKFKADADKYDADRKAYVAKHGEAATKQNTDLPPSHPQSAENVAKREAEAKKKKVSEALRPGFTHKDAGEAQRRREQTLKDNPKIAAEVERRRVAANPAMGALRGKPVKEEVLDEANHREFASQGKMHPDMAKHMKTGEHMDYYEPKTGDKVHGKVMKNDGKEVHVQQTHDSYDPKKKGSVHKFTVSTKLDEKKEDPPFDGPYTKVKDTVTDKSGAKHTPMSRAKHLAQQAAIAIAKKKVKEEFDMDITTEQALELLEAVKKQDIPAFLRKARGDKPLNLDDLKKNDSLSDKNNLAKARGVKEEVEELDELSKGTLGSYVKKAKGSLIGSSQVMGMGSKMTGQKTHDKAEKKVEKRASGINKAVDRLTKEETEMNSFKSYMQEDLDEAMWPGTPEYIKKFGTNRGAVGTSSKTAKGTQTVTKTGVKHERDYESSEKDDKPESGEKRGRGRPKGAASGARQKGSAAKADDRYDSTGFKLHLPNKNR